MDAKLFELMDSVQVCEPVGVNGMQLFGLRWDSDRSLDYKTLDEAMAEGLLEVREVSERGRVPDVLIGNNSEQQVFLMAGEQVVGAKQNRVLNASMMIPARKQSTVPVSCVERGRWGYRSRAFASTGTSSHGKLRKMMSLRVTKSYKSAGSARSDQGEVWAEIDRKLTKMGSVSPSDALEQAYDDRRDRLQKMLDGSRVPADCCGVAFAIGGRIAGVDLFDKPETLQRLLPKLVKAYALDAMEEPASAQALDAGRITAWLRSGRQVKVAKYRSPGLGHDLRLEGGKMAGAALVVDERPVHVELFPEDGGPKA